jgi:hypothetical protein
VAQRNPSHRELKFASAAFDEVAAEVGQMRTRDSPDLCGRKVCAPADTEVVLGMSAGDASHENARDDKRRDSNPSPVFWRSHGELMVALDEEP